jgi:hypothetical protein
LQRRRIKSTDYRLGYKLFVNNSWDYDGWAAYLVSLQNTIKNLRAKQVTVQESNQHKEFPRSYLEH